MMKLCLDIYKDDLSAAFPGVPFTEISILAEIPPNAANNALEAIAAIRAANRTPRQFLVDPLRLRIVVVE